jgi:phosphoglycerate dehydrogenase-like enzyme
MTTKSVVLMIAWAPDSIWSRLRSDFTDLTVIDARDQAVLETHLPEATITYGLPPVSLLSNAPALRWIQLSSAGVPWELCDTLINRNVQVTNLAGLYGPSIAEHALALMLMLARNLHQAHRQQHDKLWQRDLAKQLTDLHGKTAGIIGLGNIGQNIARLCRSFGMRVVGCRRTVQPTPHVDQLYPRQELHALLGEADFVVVAAPFTRETDGLLGRAEFAAMKRGAFYVNVSRGGVAQEPALLDALRSGQLAGAGLDVFAAEPLAADHPFWSMPQVIVSPHYSGETVNTSSRPGELFLRNLRAYLGGQPIGHRVDLRLGY